MVNRDRSLLDFRQDVSALALLSNCISLQIGSVFEKQNCEQLSFCFKGQNNKDFLITGLPMLCLLRTTRIRSR